jgi:hypothetical protein
MGIAAPKPRSLTDPEVVEAMKAVLEELGVLREVAV